MLNDARMFRSSGRTAATTTLAQVRPSPYEITPKTDNLHEGGLNFLWRQLCPHSRG